MSAETTQASPQTLLSAVWVEDFLSISQHRIMSLLMDWMLIKLTNLTESSVGKDSIYVNILPVTSTCLKSISRYTLCSVSWHNVREFREGPGIMQVNDDHDHQRCHDIWKEILLIFLRWAPHVQWAVVPSAEQMIGIYTPKLELQ